jgi:hypothetical protein
MPKQQPIKKTTVTKKISAKIKPREVNLQGYMDEIRARAKEIYLQRGNGPGDDLSDWLQAEREIKNKYGIK